VPAKAHLTHSDPMTVSMFQVQRLPLKTRVAISSISRPPRRLRNELDAGSIDQGPRESLALGKEAGLISK
jgi:hypothetical protein